MAASLVSDARRRGGLSQRELARRAGVSRTTVAEIEAGQRDPTLGTLRNVLRAAGWDIDVRLSPADDHDATLERTLDHMDPNHRQEWEASFERFVNGLAKGLPGSRPLTAADERHLA